MKYKSIYGTQLKPGDVILYWYEVCDVMKYSIGTVDVVCESSNWQQSYVKLTRQFESWLDGSWKPAEVKKSKLTNPNFLIIGKEVELPPGIHT